MKKQKLGHSGFHLIELVIILVVLGVITGVGFMVFNKSSTRSSSRDDSDGITWSFDEQKLEWVADGGTPPDCKEPFKFDAAPMDISKVTAVLMPGSYRGYSYKPHGGFGTPDDLQGKVDVKMPMDATLVGLTRYHEGEPADLQYLLTFENDCGIAFRFDHIYTLSPELQALAEKTPEPKLNDTRTSPDDAPPRTDFKSGQVIATQIGLPSMKIYGFDFGVYDYRQRNEISKNSEWAALHGDYESLEWFGVCWFDMLPGTDAETVKAASLVQRDTRRTVNIVSDYCENATYQTLDINDGKPTDG